LTAFHLAELSCKPVRDNDPIKPVYLL